MEVGAPVARSGRRQRAVPVTEASAVAEVRRRATSAAERVGLDVNRRSDAGIVATEMATNLVKHAVGGEVLIREVAGAVPALELVSVDRGPGMGRLDESLRDGFSSGRSPGTGLGAISRLSSLFDIDSAPGVGTIVWSRLQADARRPPGSSIEVGVVCLAHPGEEETGDGWVVQTHAGGGRVLVVDGLGHGAGAARAADEASGFFSRERSLSPAEVVEQAHGVLRPTRGAAMAAAELDAERGLVRYAGVGNISAAILASGRSRSLVSSNGTVGHVMGRVREYQEPFPGGAVLVLCTDGISTRWQLRGGATLRERHPAIMAAALYRDHARSRDDVTVVVLRAARAA